MIFLLYSKYIYGYNIFALKGKNNMKAKNLLLLGLSAVALASCGGVKGYKTVVKETVFKENLNKLVDGSFLLNPDAPYSFVIESSSSSTIEQTFYKNGSSISEYRLETKSESAVKFDNKSNVARSVGTYECLEEDASDLKTEKYDGETIYQTDKKSLYDVDVNAGTYKKSAISKPEEAVFNTVFANVKKLKSSISMMPLLPDATFYIDGDVYTAEVLASGEDDGSQRSGSTVYQVTILSDKIEFASQSEIVLKKLNYTEVIKDESTYVLKKKDVSVDGVNIDKYLDATKGFDDDDLEDLLGGLVGLADFFAK